MSIGLTASRDRPAVDLSLLIVRLAVGVIFAAHGSQKLLGAFGGPGLGKIVEMMGPIGYLVTIGEFFGGLGLIVGFLARVAAVGVAVTMAVAMVKVHLQHGFFLNWFGDKQGHGFEYHLLALALALVVIVHGAGAFSLDRALYRQVVTPNNAAGMSSVRDVC